MIPQRTKSARIGCLVSLLVCLAGGIFFVNYYQNTISCHGNTPPLKTFAVTIDPSQDQQLVEQSRRFAYKHNFRFDVGDANQATGEFLVLMIGNDVEVLTKNSPKPGEYEIKFYNYDCLHPTVVSDIDDLVKDLKSFIREIPNVTITEKD